MGNKIAQLRAAKGFSQSQLADIMGVGKQTIANWENGRREPDLDSLYRLSEVFESSIDYIVGNALIGDIEFFTNLDFSFDECLDGKPICYGIPEAPVIIKALGRLSPTQRDKLLNVCAVIYPDEFSDLISKLRTNQDKGGISCQEQQQEPRRGAEQSDSEKTDDGKPGTP
jgi:transcriptional regulator with XRE-family HTH domain